MSGMCGVRGRLLACALFAFILVVGLCDESAAGQAAMADSIAENIAASKDLLDINMATAAQLKALPGMGDAYVQRVIAGRPYTAKNQLTMRGILPAEAYDKIKVLIVAHRPKP